MTCSSCGRELPGEFPFCPYCGAALTEGVVLPVREERKVVTVLFADLVGFTARAEHLDPEDVRAMLARYHAHLRSELERFGGTVEKFIGDAVMALFGAPIAHEDDPERAVRAALAIRDWAREQDDLQVRIAVNTGEALVTLDARPGEGEAMAAGDVVNSAARLQVAAPLNGVLVGEQVYRATNLAIDYEQVDSVVAKGRSEPLRAWVAVEARSRFGVDAPQRVLAPLVGRTRELELLVSALGRAREERSPQLVTLVGVPGIGKSRLVSELFKVVEQDSELVRWRQGRSLPYGEGVTFWALAEIVKAEAGILESDTSEETERKLGVAVSRIGADQSESRWLERHLGPLVGVAQEGPTSLDESFAAWRRFLEGLAEERPFVLVLEDLHWADDALLDFVDRLVDWARGVPLLVLGTGRPELLQRRSGWGGGKLNALTISLPPLTDEEAARLVGALLDGPVLDERMRESLLARAGGNPLYAEQYARVLLEHGDVSELPETVQGIIAARLDALSEDEKRLLQDAAVIGKVFWLGAVEAVDGIDSPRAEELLHMLERKEFVQRARVSSVANESEYAFRHVLIRDVAYGQIPRAARSHKHRRAAAWIESLGRPEDQSELLAHHYLEALELAEAAGLDAAVFGESARLALRDAGDRAAALCAVKAAERFYDAALKLWPEDDPDRPELLLRRAIPVLTLGGGDQDRLVEARDSLLAAGDKVKAAEAEMALSWLLWMEGKREAANEAAQRARVLIEGAPPSRSVVWTLVRLASRTGISGDRASALALASQARDVAEELGWEEGLSEVHSMLAMVGANEGDPRSLEDFDRAIEIGLAAGALGTLTTTYNNLSVAHVILGDLDAAEAARLEGARLAARLGSEAQDRWFNGVLTEHHYRRGRWDEALAMADAFLAEVESGSPHYLAYQIYALRAEMRAGRGDSAGAISDAESALPIGRALADPQALYYVLPACAHVLTRVSEGERAVPLVDEFLEVLDSGVRLSFAVIELPAFVSTAVALGRGAQLTSALARRPSGPWVDAAQAYVQGDYATAAEGLRRIGSRPDEAEARVRAAESLVAEGRHEEADEQLEQALSFYRLAGATALVRECEALRRFPARSSD